MTEPANERPEPPLTDGERDFVRFLVRHVLEKRRRERESERQRESEAA